ncbi:hypothetical protein ALI22I_24015 [Saccharothrix sp. ALI-22-I]|uniref:DUF6886 family protein n=1 Tax=Saccharothrix sp. ALI-22-I TaxID=1933778 RepID=UPI00097C52B8|nr:DUF6886 family protein [Saccharothrix sp. ALI-22-I]ONI86694.1 hypothetical protein ALI22I_24015 [Saccharothrix sp. ALI-22-I]
MRPAQGEVLHFSEDPTITRFEPHVAATARQPGAYVWAVDHGRSPDYWFPRQCPRAMTWVEPTTSAEDRAWLGAERVHAIEFGWLRRMQTTRLYAYRFDAGAFRPIGDPPNAHVATEPVEPLGEPEPVGDLLALHEEAGIEVRLMTNLWPFWRRVVGSTLGFSGIRLRNAVPEPA